MFSQIVSAIRDEIINELEHRVPKGLCLVFRYFNDEDEDVVLAPINVGHPCCEETDYFPGVMRVYRNEKGKVVVVMMDEVGGESEREITDIFFDLGDLAAILDAIVGEECKEEWDDD